MTKELKVPGKGWTWHLKPGQTEGVHTYEGCLTWYTRMREYWAGGGARQQSFEDFLKNGPPVSEVPVNVLEELKALLKDFT